MIVSIHEKRVVLERLNEGIKKETNSPYIDFRKDIKYLVMSTETRNEIERENAIILSMDKNIILTHSYNGIPVAIYDGLNFGEVDIVR